MPSGKVKYFNNEKGYGFIAPHDGSTDVFAHRNECNAERNAFLEIGDEVSYEVAFDAKKGKDAATTLSPWRTGDPDGNRGGGGGGGGGNRESEKTCRDFLAGKCNRDSCKFSHDDGGRGRSRSRDRGPPHGFGHPQPGYGFPSPGPGYGYPPPGYGAYGPPGYGSPGLPPGWEQHPDPATGRPYFCNRATGETSWTPPAAPSAPCGGGGPGGLPPGWEEARDPQSGKTYYFNRATNTTQWTPP